jgi:murein DD-endopeptidase MepM/ murein hydrolase activator NlpD
LDFASDGTHLDARDAEEQLLGSDDEYARYLLCQPFTREIAAFGIVSTSLDRTLTEANVPAAAVLEARKALATVIDLDRDVVAGDSLYFRYEQTFTAEGQAIGVGRVLWVELATKAKRTIAIHRFRAAGDVERFWLASGEAASLPSMRLPLDKVNVSSGFGMRADPFDQPPPLTAGDRPAPSSDTNRYVLPTVVSTNGSKINVATPLGASLGLALRPGLAPPARRGFQTQFMHEGVDLAAPTGTPVYAASDGVVTGAAPNGGYGNWIRIDHQGSSSTVYGHLSEFAPGIKEGVQVSQGELIGFVGNTGRSTGPHLHFEILRNGKAVDPLTSPETKRAQLSGADLERFRKQVKHALAERDRETAVAQALYGEIAEGRGRGEK